MPAASARRGPALGEEARDAVGHDFRHAADVARDHRHAGGEGLEQRLGNALRAGRRQHEAVHHGEERRHVVAEAREDHVLRETGLAREPLHPAPADAVAHEQERGRRMDGPHRGKGLEQMRVALRPAEHRDGADHGRRQAQVPKPARRATPVRKGKVSRSTPAGIATTRPAGTPAPTMMRRIASPLVMTRSASHV